VENSHANPGAERESWTAALLRGPAVQDAVTPPSLLGLQDTTTETSTPAAKEEEWIEKYRAALKAANDTGDSGMPVLKRLAEVSDRFSYAMVMLLCKGIIKTRHSVHTLIFASRESAAARKPVASVTLPPTSEAQIAMPIPAAAANAARKTAGLPTAAAQARTANTVPGVVTQERISSSPRLNRGMAVDRRIS